MREATQRARYMTPETIGAISILHPSAYPPWHPDKAIQPTQEHRSYTTRWSITQTERVDTPDYYSTVSIHYTNRGQFAGMSGAGFCECKFINEALDIV